MSEEWITIKDAAKRSHYSQDAIRRLIRDKRIGVRTEDRFLGPTHGIRTIKLVNLREITAWQSREKFQPDRKRSTAAVDRWIESHIEILRTSQPGDGKRFHAQCMEETGIRLTLNYFYRLLVKHGIRFRFFCPTAIRERLAKRSDLLMCNRHEGAAILSAETGLVITPKTFADTRREYLKSINEGD